MNNSNFSKGIKMLEEYYNTKLTDANIDIYWLRLKGYDDKTFEGIIMKCIDTLRFFPKIADIKDLIEGNSEDEAELAWICLLDKMERIGHYQSVSFPEYPAIASVVEALGGWIEVCEIKYDEEKWVKKEFIKLYSIMKKRGDYPDKLMGQFEIDNGNKYTEKFMLEGLGRNLDGKKVEREKIEGKEDKLLENKGGKNA